jgi:hypothetical protein
LVDVDRLGRDLVTAREGKKLICQLRATLGGADRVLHILQNALFSDMGLSQFEVRDNRRQKIVEVMSHPVGKLSNRLHLLRLTELLVEGAAVRHIARDLGKPDQDAGIVLHGVDNSVCPKPRTILADAPTLRLKSSLLSGGHQRTARQSVFLILAAVKYGKMLTNMPGSHSRRRQIAA